MKKWNKHLLAVTAAVALCTAGFSITASAVPPCYGFGPGLADDVQTCYDVPLAKKEDGRHAERWKAFLTKRHTELHDKLKLTANQEEAWQAYTAATMKNMTPSKIWSQIDFDSMSSPERMQQALDLLKERETRMKAQLAALKTFYAKLTPEQQKIFDTETSSKNWRWKAKDRWQMKQKPESK